MRRNVIVTRASNCIGIVVPTMSGGGGEEVAAGASARRTFAAVVRAERWRATSARFTTRLSALESVVAIGPTDDESLPPANG